jgi:carbon storage regulator
MLVLSRKPGEKIQIGKNVVVTVVALSRSRVRLGIDCPIEIPVHREEVQRRIWAAWPFINFQSSQKETSHSP